MKSLISCLDVDQTSRPDFRMEGRVMEVRGPILYVSLPRAAIGDICTLYRRDGTTIRGQVVAFTENRIAVTPFHSTLGVSPGDTVFTAGAPEEIPFSTRLLGRVVDAFGTPIDGGEGISDSYPIPLHRQPPHPLLRRGIETQLITGVRSVDALCPIGYGQRLGLFAGAGVGKSTLLSMLTSHAAVDAVVVGLVGERGREVGEFVEHLRAIGGFSRTVLVVSTSDEAPLRRMRAPVTATAIAEEFRSQGKRVLLLIDSLTRMARAMREVGLAAGELPVRQGYPSSVFTELPRLLERAGNDEHGSITALYTILRETRDTTDVLSEEVKSILDGHLMMNEEIAARGIRPAIDFTASISRLTGKLHDRELRGRAQRIISAIGRLQNDRELIMLGGTPDSELKAALTHEEAICRFLTQLPDAYSSWNDTETESRRIIANLEHARSAIANATAA